MADRRASSSAMRPLTAHERLRATIGLAPSALVRLGLEPDAWDRWNEQHGPAFRVLHGVASAADVERIEAGPAPVGELPLPPGL